LRIKLADLPVGDVVDLPGLRSIEPSVPRSPITSSARPKKCDLRTSLSTVDLEHVGVGLTDVNI